jgi:hypothetical protein
VDAELHAVRRAGITNKRVAIDIYILRCAIYFEPVKVSARPADIPGKVATEDAFCDRTEEVARECCVIALIVCFLEALGSRYRDTGV